MISNKFCVYIIFRLKYEIININILNEYIRLVFPIGQQCLDIR